MKILQGLAVLGSLGLVLLPEYSNAIGQTADGVHIGAPTDPSEKLSHSSHFIPMKGKDEKVNHIDNYNDFIQHKTQITPGSTFEQ